MKILILSPTQPIPTINGSRLRIFNFIKHLSKQNKITLITLNQKDGSYVQNIESEMRSYCLKTYGIKHYKPKIFALIQWIFSLKPYRHVKFSNRKFKKTFNHILKNNNFDVIFCNFLDMAQYFKDIDNLQKKFLLIIDQHNVDESWYEKFIRMDSFLFRLFGKENIRRLKKQQKKDYRYFDICLSVSKKDANITKNILDKNMQVVVAPNGVDLNFFSSEEHLSDKTLLFCGSMDTIMNQDAVLYFCNKIFPIVKSKVPNVRFIVVGRNPPLRIKKLYSKDIHITGTVDDVRPFYNKASVVVAPFRLGAGTKLKILEAMAMKVPIVSTSIGCQGIEVENGKHVWIADDELEFAEKIINIIQNKIEITNIIEEAYSLVAKRYEWKNIISYVEKIIIETIKK